MSHCIQLAIAKFSQMSNVIENFQINLRTRILFLNSFIAVSFMRVKTGMLTNSSLIDFMLHIKLFLVVWFVVDSYISTKKTMITDFVPARLEELWYIKCELLYQISKASLCRPCYTYVVVKSFQNATVYP